MKLGLFTDIQKRLNKNIKNNVIMTILKLVAYKIYFANLH